MGTNNDNNGQTGGYLVGRRHENGGIQAINTDTDQPLELETDEVIITRKAVLSPQKHQFNGKEMTNLEILSSINQQGGGVALMELGGQVAQHYSCSCSEKKHLYDGEELSEKDLIKKMEEGGHVCGCSHKRFPAALLPQRHPGEEVYKKGGKVSKRPGKMAKEMPEENAGAFKGVDYPYQNPYDLNRAIEALLDSRPKGSFESTELAFFRHYTGYGGLEKYGAEGIGLLYEYYTPREIARRMWGLAYKYGYQGGSVLEPACGIGEFFNYAPQTATKVGMEINPYSTRIAQLLHPAATIRQQHFEEVFIRNRDTIRAKTNSLDKFDLVIGNPPYGDFQGRFAGMGEKAYTRAGNYIDYFIVRGLDLLLTDGLLIYIIGAEVASGGTPFLQQQENPVKRDIAAKADLLDAYRLPNGVFERTDVLTDIIVLKKK